MKITFIGGGNMGSALISGLVKSGAKPGDISVVEPDPEKRSRIEKGYGVTATEEADVLGDVVLLGVKPQQLREVAAKLSGRIGSRLVISIAAGIRSEDLSCWLNGHRNIVRVMPNTPAQVSKGISALYALPEVDSSGRRTAEAVLSSVGSTIWLDEEGKMDDFTALCGSGPAYVFYFIEAMLEAARRMGFDALEAKKMVLETFSGSIALALESPEDAGILRQKVTSKGGTTERALNEMEKNDVKDHVVEAVFAARERSRELAVELGKASC